MSMNSSKLLSGRVPVTAPNAVSNSRYEFLGLSDAEPSLGVPVTSGSVFTSTSNGDRSWSNAISINSNVITFYSEYSFPQYDGVWGQVLYTDGNGQLGFATIPAGRQLINGTSNVVVRLNSDISMSVDSVANVVVVSTNNVAINADLSVTGNITGANLLGPYANGNSNINIPIANGNITVGINGVANTVVFTDTGVNVAGTLNSNSITLTPTGSSNTTTLQSSPDLTAPVTYTFPPDLTYDTGVLVAYTDGNMNTVPLVGPQGNITYDLFPSLYTPILYPFTPTILSASEVGTPGSLPNNTTYYFRVSGMDQNGNYSAPSPEVSVTTTRNNSSIQIDYSNNSYFTGLQPSGQSFTRYRVWYGTTSGGQNRYFETILTVFTMTTTGTSGTIPLINRYPSVYLSTISPQYGNQSVPAWGTNGVGVVVLPTTITDNTTTASSTIANAYMNLFDTPTYSAANTEVVVTNLVGTYFRDPAAGTNVTATNRYSIGANSLLVTGNATAGNFIGRLANSNSSVNIPSANGNVNITANGNTTLTVTSTGANLVGNLVVGNITNANVISANYLVSNSGCIKIAQAVIAVDGNNAGIFASLVDDVNIGLMSNVTLGSTTGNITSQGTFNAPNVNVTGTVAAQSVKVGDLYSNRAPVNVNINTVIDSFSINEYRSAKYTIRASNDLGYQALEVLLVHDNINSITTVYGSLSTTGSDIITLDSDINTGIVELRATGLGANTQVNLLGTYVPD